MTVFMRNNPAFLNNYLCGAFCHNFFGTAANLIGEPIFLPPLGKRIGKANFIHNDYTSFLLIALNSAWTGVAIKSEKVQIHFKEIFDKKQFQ